MFGPCSKKQGADERVHRMKLHCEPYEMIKSGKKTIELRLFDEKRQMIQVGDEIEFTSRTTGEKQLTEVCAIHLFNTFAEIYRDFDKISLGYDIDEEASFTDLEKYYSKEEQEKYGVVGIEVRNI